MHTGIGFKNKRQHFLAVSYHISVVASLFEGGPAVLSFIKFESAAASVIEIIGIGDNETF